MPHFHCIEEWDGSLSRVTVYRKRANLEDWLKHGVNDWACILYPDGTAPSFTPMPATVYRELPPRDTWRG
jgi:hypothetical protein